MDLYDQIARNRRRSALLLAAFALLVGLTVAAVGTLVRAGPVIVPIAVVIAVVSAWVSYWSSDRIALAVSRARPAEGPEFKRYHNLVEGLCIAAGLPKPRLYVIDDPAPNAFATGRNPRHAALAVTTGLLEKMNRVELEGVLAHELSHIRNADILVSTLAVTAVGIVVLLADLALRLLWFGGPRRRDRGGGSPFGWLLGLGALVLLLLAPLVARLMQFAVSRRREYLADASAVALTRYPPGLIAALEKLRDDRTVVASASRATAQLWIESPLERGRTAETPKRGTWLNRAFDTHPPLEDRIAALRAM